MQREATVFLVDDDPAIRDSMCWFLKSRGLNVQAYSSAAEFLDARHPDKPGCLVLDVRMPQMDGLELQQKLASLHDHLPIIFVTACDEVSLGIRAMKAGAIDFLEKPVDNKALLELVHKALDSNLEGRLSGLDRAAIESRIQRLSPREKDVMELLYAGKSMKQIAVELGVTAQTVGKHRARVLEKMEVEGDTELVRLLAAHWPQ